MRLESYFTHGQLQTKIKALGIYQIIGGLFGIGLTFYLLNTNNSFTLLVFLIILFILGLYCYSIYSGIILIKNVEKGLTHSKVNQLFQLITFMAFGYGYQYTSGVFLFVGMDVTNSMEWNFSFGITSTWKITVNTDDPNFFFNLNLVAIFLVVFIERTKQKLKNLDLEQQLSFESDKSRTELPGVALSDTTEAK